METLWNAVYYLSYRVLTFFMDDNSTIHLAEKKISQTMETYLKMLDVLEQWLEKHGVNAIYADTIKLLIVILAISVLALIANFVAKRIFLTIVGHVAKKTETVFDDILVEKKVFHRLAHLAPAIIVYYSITLPLAEFPKLLLFLQRITSAYITVISLSAALAFVNALHDFFLTLPASKSHSIKGYLQVLKIVLYSITIIAILSILFDIDATKLLSFLGASVAVLMFVFKDTILGLVASIQLSVNDMLRPGDWIEMQSRKADGIVQDITLTTVKIQNWDKTVTTVPTYALVSDSFTNWRGMEESEGRRVKRSINIDMKSVQFYTADLVERISKNQIVKEVFDAKKFVNESVANNGTKALTNLGIFRAYLEAFLRKMPVVHPEMTFLVHYLQPNEHGLPLEMIFFTKEKDGKSFERLQCELYDHIFAIIPDFDLRVFQRPTDEIART